MNSIGESLASRFGAIFRVAERDRSFCYLYCVHANNAAFSFFSFSVGNYILLVAGPRNRRLVGQSTSGQSF